MCFVALGYYMKSTASFSRVVSYDADLYEQKQLAMIRVPFPCWIF